MKDNKQYRRYTILFVCSGNSCRSPMAAGLLHKKLYPDYGDRLKIHSAGTLGINNNPATLNAIQVTKDKGADIANHRSKGIVVQDLAEADIIFALAENHKEFLDLHFPQYKENVFLLKNFATGSDKPRDPSIDDPIGGSLEVYRKTINEIEIELNRIIPQLKMLIDNKLNDS